MQVQSDRQIEEPVLDKPGAGLPAHEWFFAKYILFPYIFHTTSVAEAIESYEAESRAILSLASSLDSVSRGERRLIKRLPGLEDSSRYWSVAMTMRHMNIVNRGMLAILTNLTAGNNQLPRRGIADVNPPIDVDTNQILDEFAETFDKFVREASVLNFDANEDCRHPHPWFGPLTARQWVTFAPRHQAIHRKQIDAIIKLL